MIEPIWNFQYWFSSIMQLQKTKLQFYFFSNVIIFRYLNMYCIDKIMITKLNNNNENNHLVAAVFNRPIRK